MTGKHFLLDTNIFINAIHQKLKLPAAHYSYSVITELELLGFPRLSTTDEQAIKSFLGQLTRIELNEQVRQETIRIRRSLQIKLPDSIISASAVIAGATLVTDDSKLAQNHNGSAISLAELVKHS